MNQADDKEWFDGEYAHPVEEKEYSIVDTRQVWPHGMILARWTGHAFQWTDEDRIVQVRDPKHVWWCDGDAKEAMLD